MNKWEILFCQLKIVIFILKWLADLSNREKEKNCKNTTFFKLEKIDSYSIKVMNVNRAFHFTIGSLNNTSTEPFITIEYINTWIHRSVGRILRWVGCSVGWCPPGSRWGSSYWGSSRFRGVSGSSWRWHTSRLANIRCETLKHPTVRKSNFCRKYEKWNIYKLSNR